MKPYLAFDLEIAKQIPDGAADWRAYRPFGVSCAATFLSTERAPRVWYSKDRRGQPLSRMKREDLRDLLTHLSTGAEHAAIVTWNGLGFDFDVLAEETGQYRVCAKLAYQHVDLMFHLFCLLGHPIGLNQAAKGMGLDGKTEGMNGALAPELWAAGEHQTVLDYAAQDVRTTLEIALMCEERGYLRWFTRRGSPRVVDLPDGWLPVHQALRLPEPDTSWMRNPWPRSKFTSWLKGLV
jgi:hypothetical protein